MSASTWAAAVAVLPDDGETRGNWHPAYGQRSYVFFALGENRAAVKRGEPLVTRVYTGRPDREPQVWRSRGDWELDARVLRNPLTWRRMPGVINDWVSDAKLGKGPNLFLDVSIPDGLFVLSLYFFEVDWIQYRAYTLTVQAADGKVLATTPVEDFYEGKYKRLAVSGPSKLTLHIRRQMSTNALVSAMFLDPITPSPPFPVAFHTTAWRVAPSGAPWSCSHPSFLAAKKLYEDIESLLAKAPDAFLARVNHYAEVAVNLEKALASAELPPEHRTEALWLLAQSRRQLGDMAGKRRALTDFAHLLGKSNPSRATTAEILDATAQKCLGAGQMIEAQALHDGLVAVTTGDVADACLKLAALYAGKDDLYAAGKAGAAARALATSKTLPEAERTDRAVKLARRFLSEGKPLLAHEAFLGVLAVSSPSKLSADDFDQFVSNAKKVHNARPAAEACERWLRENPGHARRPAVYHALIECRLLSEAPAAADDACQRLRAELPTENTADLEWIVAEGYLRRVDLSRAKAAYEAIQQRFPNSSYSTRAGTRLKEVQGRLDAVARGE